MGRQRIGKHKTYRISDEDYSAFLQFCESRGLRPTQVVRDLVLKFYSENMFKDLKIGVKRKHDK